MSDIALDRGLFLPGPFTDWYRERPFQIAFAVSVLFHALLIAFVPGLRSVQIEAPQVLNVEIVIPEEQRPVVQEHAPRVEPQPLQPPEAVREPELAPPVHQVQPIERQVVPPEPVVEAVVTPPEPDMPVVPMQHAELAPPVPQEAPRPEPIALPRPDPMPEQRIEIPVEPKPVPQVQPVLPPPVARVEPRLEPQLQPRIEPRPEPLPQPITEVPPPVAALVPPAPPASTSRLAVEVDPIVVEAYKKMITAEIKQYKDYPLLAMRRKWEGTTVVALKLSADGGVREVAVAESSGKDVLDKAALKMIQRALPLPKPPQALHGRTIKVPILFKLEG